MINFVSEVLYQEGTFYIFDRSAFKGGRIIE